LQHSRIILKFENKCHVHTTHITHGSNERLCDWLIYWNLQTKKCYQSQFGCDELISLCVSPGGFDPIYFSLRVSTDW